MEMFIYAVIMLAVSYALAPKPPSAKPGTLEQGDIPVAEQGTPIPVVFGKVTCKAPNVVWYGSLSTTRVKS